MEMFESILFEFFSQIVIIEGRTKIKEFRFWPYFPRIVLIDGVLIIRNYITIVINSKKNYLLNLKKTQYFDF